jgi:riboflavin-specific deaminase-like protein
MMSHRSAWDLLLELRKLDWSTVVVHRAKVAEVPLEVRRGGDWCSDAALTAQETDLLDVLLPLVARSGSLTIAQLGQSLDGRIATETGDSWYINGQVARTHLHRLRALVDAVLVGAGTAAEDCPALTVRHVDGPDPVPVILDPRGRVKPIGPLFERQPNQPPVLHLVGPGIDLASSAQGVERLPIALEEDGKVDPRSVLAVLAARGLQRLLVEGGGVTVSGFLDSDCLDHLHLLIAPLIIGSGRPGLALPPIEALSEARRPPIRSYALGDELLVDVRLR